MSFHYLPKLLILLFLAVLNGAAQATVWVADKGDGNYKNPILHADYSDPDAIRVGDDFYLVASSFNVAPGLPILHSKDLVNWEIIGHVYQQQPPVEHFAKVRHGGGSWAPALRYHNGEFYLYYPDPDFGIYLTKAKNAAGPWSEPVLIKKAKGWIDPAPFWDEDGQAYLISAFAGSRSGVKSILLISRMSANGEKLLDDGAIVFDGHDQDPTVEGPKFYKRKGYYYIFAPAGGVATGWQLVLRAKAIYGPYERKVVLAQGKTSINGPHQGAWVETQTGESWFLHFQDKEAFGRVVHLQPMKWVNDWPQIGVDPNGDGVGEPVLQYRKPNVGKIYPIVTPPDSDEFNAPRLGWQWQWQANPQSVWALPAGSYGFLRLYCAPLPEDFANFGDVPNLLLQKFPAPRFSTTTKVTFTPRSVGEKTGLLVMGLDYAYLAVTKRDNGLFASLAKGLEVEKRNAEQEIIRDVPISANTFYLRVSVDEKALCQFSLSEDGLKFRPIGTPFQAKPGRWIGTKVGIFAVRPEKRSGETGYADFDWFRVSE